MTKLYLLSFLLIMFVFSCKTKNTEGSLAKGKLESFEYAKLFNIETFDGYKYINVLNKSGNTICKILKIEKGKNIPIGSKADYILKDSITNIGILSSTNIGFLNSINKSHLIQSSTNPQRIYDTVLFKKYKEGKIINIGDAMTTNVEQILALTPDIVFYTGYEENQKTKKLLKRAGIAYIPVTEWKEESILGRTEWIKFFGELFNARSMADSIFSTKVKKYNSLKAKTQGLIDKPTVIYGSNFKGTWYMPGGKSYMAQILHDAGANYHFRTDTSRSTLHLNIETVIDIMENADYWLSPSANNMNELQNADKHYKIFKAFKNGRVYNYTARMNVNGFNDYWESGVMNPDIILSDIIHILHPELLNNYKLHYYKQLH